MKTNTMLFGLSMLAIWAIAVATTLPFSSANETSASTPISITFPETGENMRWMWGRWMHFQWSWMVLTEEQKAEMEAQKTAWEGLSETQKWEIYSLQEKITDLRTQIVDKLQGFGVISEKWIMEFGGWFGRGGGKMMVHEWRIAE